MRKNNFKIIFSLLFIMICQLQCIAADVKIENYFNDLNPIQHIHHFDDRKGSLSKDSIAYDDIIDYVHYYNPEVLTNWNAWENNKSAEDVYNDYIDAYDRIYDSASGQDSDVQAGIGFAQADAMLIQADKNVSDSYVDFLTYYLREKQLTLSTKILDINYHKSNFELLNAAEALAEAQRKEDSATNALKYGSGTEVDLLMAKKAVVDANTNIITITSAQNTNKRNLVANCGMINETNVNIVPITVYDNFDITTINFDSDYEYALSKNVQYEIYKRKKENARTDEVKNEYDILIEAAPKNIYNDLQTKYMNILDVLNTKASRDVAYSLAFSSYNKANDEYKNGRISLKEFKTAEYNLNAARNNLELIKYDLSAAIENYSATKEGFGNC